MDHKRCGRCKVEKSIDAFDQNKNTCKECRRYCKKYYDANREQEIGRALKSQKKQGRKAINDYKRKHYKENPLTNMVQAAKKRAKEGGFPFDITRDDLTMPDRCPILGIEIKCGTGRPNHNSPSLDKIIPELGYVKSNVRVISYRANTLKANASLEELRRVVADAEAIERTRQPI